MTACHPSHPRQQGPSSAWPNAAGSGQLSPLQPGAQPRGQAPQGALCTRSDRAFSRWANLATLSKSPGGPLLTEPLIQHLCQEWGWRLRTSQAPRDINSHPLCVSCSGLSWIPSACSQTRFICIVTLAGFTVEVTVLVCLSFSLRQRLFPIYLCIPSAWRRAWVSAGIQSFSLYLFIKRVIEW